MYTCILRMHAHSYRLRTHISIPELCKVLHWLPITVGLRSWLQNTYESAILAEFTVLMQALKL